VLLPPPPPPPPLPPLLLLLLLLLLLRPFHGASPSVAAAVPSLSWQIS
jgi:hypothetical protein